MGVPVGRPPMAMDRTPAVARKFPMIEQVEAQMPSVRKMMSSAL
jgi:hypothetical protein